MARRRNAMPHATLLFAGLLTLAYVYLILRVTQRRRRYRVAYDATQEHPDLQRAIRAHGNFQEYTPLFLILLYLTETTTHLEWLCYGLGTIFLLGRLSHAYSLLTYETQSLAKGERIGVAFRFRFYAMVQTLLCLLIPGVLLLLQALKG
jgi:uncharacterized membrane protein YecN with MAPEG domain